MVTIETLKEHLSLLGAEISNEDETLQKCKELCEKYHMDEETFAEKWIAFIVPRTGGFDISVEGVQLMERHELIPNAMKEAAVKNEVVNTIFQNRNVQGKKHDDEDILGTYNIGSSKKSQDVAKRPRSPDSSPDVIAHNEKRRAVESTDSENLQTSTKVPSAPKVVLSFGKQVTSWKNSSNVKVEVRKHEAEAHVPNNAMFMFDLTNTRSNLRAMMCQDIGEKLCKLWADSKKTDIKCTWNVMLPSETPFRTFGRVRFVKDKKNNKTIFKLDACKSAQRSHKRCDAILDLKNSSECSLFPGQIIAVQCSRSIGNVLMVQEVFSKAYVNLPREPKLLDDINIFVASGPFTPREKLDYQVLWDFIDHINELRPHVLILIGPIVDYSNTQIQDCSIAENFQEYFDIVVEKLIRKIQGTTQVILVASNGEAHHVPVFPTPASTLGLGIQQDNLHLLPDPCTLNIQGLTIGVTSVDVLAHIGRYEIATTKARTDRMSRLIDHVLSQSCYYPLYPPLENLNVDTILWERHAFMTEQPHILVLPSMLRHYCKAVNGSFVVNPERLQKHLYARLSVKRIADGKWDANNVSCEIVKI